jgi:polyphosphate kinase 2 (PPK2 family)
VNPDRFLVSARPNLAAIEKFPKTTFAAYERSLAAMQKTLRAIQQAYLGTRECSVIVLEGWDTAGKGGVVRRLGWTLDPRSFKVHPISAPTAQEKAQHYLQRFWNKLPGHGQIVVFDRSWYGRVLVERVEELARPEEWQRAYAEINEFENILATGGIRIMKIFLHITSDEQVKRFQERITHPLKQWKLTYEDFRNRSRWQEYETAIEDMMEKTSTQIAPWHLIPANDKLFGRLAAFTIMIGRMGAGVDLEPKPLDPRIAEEAARLLDKS